MNGFITNIEKDTLDNSFFRRVLYTAKNSQLVVMALNPGEEIGEEVHKEHDQFIRIESGEGEVTLDGVVRFVKDDFAIVIPAGVRHNVKNTADGMMKLYTIYSPPEHLDGTVHQTKEDALKA